jgi:hypothetical protein
MSAYVVRHYPQIIAGTALVPSPTLLEKAASAPPVLGPGTVDTLGKMLRSGTVCQEMHDAAKDFEVAFIVANLDPIRALPIVRVTGTGREPDLNERQLDARRRVHKALQAMGGLSSPAGSCVWHVLGLQRSVREWAMGQGWGGRPVRQEQAQGILVAALGMLAAHFGYGEAGRPPEGGSCGLGRPLPDRRAEIGSGHGDGRS